MPKLPKPHRLNWFTNRVNKQVIKNKFDLFSPPVLITSAMHAKVLYITQTEKNYRYYDIDRINNSQL